MHTATISCSSVRELWKTSEKLVVLMSAWTSLESTAVSSSNSSNSLLSAATVYLSIDLGVRVVCFIVDINSSVVIPTDT